VAGRERKIRSGIINDRVRKIVETGKEFHGV
jgi:hypothetical protein